MLLILRLCYLPGPRCPETAFIIAPRCGLTVIYLTRRYRLIWYIPFCHSAYLVFKSILPIAGVGDTCHPPVAWIGYIQTLNVGPVPEGCRPLGHELNRI